MDYIKLPVAKRTRLSDDRRLMEQFYAKRAKPEPDVVVSRVEFVDLDSDKKSIENKKGKSSNSRACMERTNVDGYVVGGKLEKDCHASNDDVVEDNNDGDESLMSDKESVGIKKGDSSNSRRCAVRTNVDDHVVGKKLNKDCHASNDDDGLVEVMDNNDGDESLSSKDAGLDVIVISDSEEEGKEDGRLVVDGGGGDVKVDLVVDEELADSSSEDDSEGSEDETYKEESDHGQSLDESNSYEKSVVEGKDDSVGVPSVKDNINGLRFQSRDVIVDVPLPHGTELITIGDVKLPPKDVGNALQFLEFCAAFGKTLKMKKGQSSIILQELMNGRSRTLRRSEQHSPVVHFHIQLLSLLQKEFDIRPQNLTSSNGKNSWLLALKNCLSESPNAIDSLPTDCLDREAGGYNSLDSSTKLRILIFLCDEVLKTARIRDWINDQESKFVKKAKQAKEKVLAAKDKKKSLKQKMMNELAKEVIANDGASLSISEHEKIVRQNKCEAAQAHKEILELKDMVPKAKERAEAVRTKPLFLDVNGRAFWRLNGYSEKSNILVQDVGNGDDSAVFGEKWITFDNEQDKVVEKHISFRERMVRAQPVAKMISSRTNV